MSNISSVEGNAQRLDGGSMYGNAPRAVWEKWSPPDELGRVALACRAMLIEHDGIRILCEAGIGAFFEPKLAERYGVQEPRTHKLLQSLKALQIAPEEIDYVILSHLHFDHAGGVLPTYAELQEGKTELVFPKATYLVGQEAWKRARNPHPRDRASFIPGLSDKLEATGRLQIVEGDRVDGLLENRLSFIYSSGHTPGQMHTVFHGNRETVIYAGDLIPGMAWVNPAITMGYDRFPELLIDEKLGLYEVASAQKWWLFFPHDPKYCAARVAPDEKGRMSPIEPQERWERKVF